MSPAAKRTMKLSDTVRSGSVTFAQALVLCLGLIGVRLDCAKATPMTDPVPVDVTATLAVIPPGTFTQPPTGTITIFDTFNGMTIVLGVITLGGQSILPSLDEGTHLISAVYSGDANYSGANSVPVALVVDSVATSLSISLGVENLALPEPGSMSLLALGLGLSAFAFRRRHSSLDCAPPLKKEKAPPVRAGLRFSAAVRSTKLSIDGVARIGLRHCQGRIRESDGSRARASPCVLRRPSVAPSATGALLEPEEHGPRQEHATL